MNSRILFILKSRGGYDYDSSAYSYGGYFSSGLYNSAKFVVDMLIESSIDAKLVQVRDNNDIDREVSKFRPDIVVIEALWVVPEKFDTLMKLHPTIRWVVRLHSNIPFLANESIAIKWIKGYARRGVKIAVNERRAFDDIRIILGSGRELLYLPNYYPIGSRTALNGGCSLHIGCYGAIRPLKNQLLQAIAAIRYADQHQKILFFHINGTRTEQGGGAVRENLRALFAGTKHLLVEDRWMSHRDFLEKLKMIDLGMQVSLSETFSIVTADMVSVGLPIVVSPEIDWASWISKVDPTNSEKITEGIKDALIFKEANLLANRHNLKKYSRISKRIWLDYLLDK